ncbi:MAG TPA: 30S ribosomal protein S12 methylthiotransferase RimO, partial [Phycisphaerae bacterium]|nr:30S ribosomal protein S12 methylthiotransferase RimO [Phycisphaerae bacterium]
MIFRMEQKPVIHVALVSLGCPKNLVDSERILGELAEAGCVVGATMDEADVIVINTCGFLSAAREESLEVIAEAVEQKRVGRAGRVVVTGCLPSRDGEQLYEMTDGIDAVIGVNDRETVLQAVLQKERVTRISKKPLPFGRKSSGDTGRFRLTPRHTGYLRIAEGCSQKCSFCTIPAIRGPFRSKPPEMVLAEARELLADGAVELNVIAQDTTAYGSDFKTGRAGGSGVASLLRSLNELDGIEWIRLMYAYPRRFDDDLIAAIAESQHVVPYVDIPLQHISTPILRRMKRRVTREETETLLHKLRKRICGLTIRTSLIVGFPGETEDQFEELLRFVREFRFEALGVFEFSPEPGTAAAEMSRQVPAHLTAERAEAVMLAQQEIAFAANERLLGATLKVLIDGVDSPGVCV